MGKFDPKVAIAGRVGTDPEVKDRQDGSKYLTFRLARDFLAMDGSVKGTKWYTVNVNGVSSPGNIAKGSKIEVRGTQRVAPAKEGAEAYYTINVEGTEDIGDIRLGKNGQPTESFSVSGHVGSDVEVGQTRAGKDFYKFSLAHNYSIRTADGEWENFPVWYNVSLYADQLPEFVKKGALIELRGVDEVYTYESKKYNETREGCSIRAFEVSVPDRSPAAARPDSSAAAPAAADEPFEAPF